MTVTHSVGLAGQHALHVTRMTGPTSWGTNRRGLQIMIGAEFVTLRGDELDHVLAALVEGWSWVASTPSEPPTAAWGDSVPLNTPSNP